MMEGKTVAVIPCYNEAARIDRSAFLSGLREIPGFHILFVNDGSTDLTLKILNALAAENPAQIKVLDLPKNGGKAAAVFSGCRHALDAGAELIGYMDADLAVSLEEFWQLRETLLKMQKQFVFGSRWQRIGSEISRKLSRHISGRIFATIASNMLGLGVYDTQCGAKIFGREAAETAFREPLSVNWVFDVEIFFRLLKIYPRENFADYALEVPLQKWRDVPGSKVKISHSFRIFMDLMRLYRRYGRSRD